MLASEGSWTPKKTERNGVVLSDIIHFNECQHHPFYPLIAQSLEQIDLVAHAASQSPVEQVGIILPQEVDCMSMLVVSQFTLIDTIFSLASFLQI